MKTHRLGFIWVLLLLSGCSYYNPKDVGTAPGTVTTGYNAISYAQVRDQVFTPKCTGCHSSGDQSPALDSYAAVKAALGDIKQMALVKRAMPPRKPLASDLSGLLTEWINVGAPLGNPTPPSPTPSAEPSASPSPEPTLVPLAPTFVSIHADIFEPKCIKCHSPGGKAEDVPLDSINDLLSNKLITVGNASTSKLYTTLENKKMPPKSTGMTLSDEEIQVIGQWIQDGAPEGTEPEPEPSATPSPSPTLLPLAPTFTSIRADIIETKCLSCHSAGGKAEDVPFDTRDQILSEKIVTLGNPAVSKFYTLVANKKMPPKSSGKTLSDLEIQTISEWIQQGAPE